MNCKCHGERCYLGTDGFWRCAVKKRKYERDRYDADPVHRIGKNLHDHARRRAQTIASKREALRGEVQIERHHRSALEQHPAQDHKAA